MKLAVLAFLLLISFDLAAQYNPPQFSFPSGSTLPANCTYGMVFAVVSGGNVTPNYCSSSNTWTAFGTGTGFTADGDLSGTSSSQTVVGINGTLLSGLSTGLLKVTTGTGAVSIGVAGTDFINGSGTGSSSSNGFIPMFTGSGTLANSPLDYGHTASGRATFTSMANGTMFINATTGNAVQIISQLANSGGAGDLYLDEGASSSRASIHFRVTGTDDWVVGMNGSTAWTLTDSTNSHAVFNIANNTAPANAMTANATGLVLLTVQTPAARKGTFVCTNAGSIVVANSNYITTSDVIITMNTPGGTITTPPAFKTVSTGVSFTVLCGATDTSTYNYNILN